MAKRAENARVRQAELKMLGVGSEPTFKEGKPLTKVQLIKALNWYSSASDTKTCKKWAIDWSKSNISADISKKLNAINPQYFTNEGFLARIHSKGVMFTSDEIASLKDRIISLTKITPDQAETTSTAPPKSHKIVEVKNPVIEAIEYSIDAAITSGKIPDIQAINAPDLMQKEGFKLCFEKLAEVETDTNHEYFLPGTIPLVRAVYSSWIRLFQKMAESADKPLQPKAKKRSNLKNESCVHDKTLNLRGYEYERLIGKKRAFLYDLESNKIGYIESDSPDGFMIDRAVIESVSHSKCKRVSAPQEFFAPFQNGKMVRFSLLQELYSKNKYRETAGLTKIGKNIMILAISKTI